MSLSPKHISTLKNRLGDAVELCDDERYLIMFRNRQIHHKELFDFSVQLSKNKKNPSRYFASIWGRKNLPKTIVWLKKLMNSAKSKAMDKIRSSIKQKENERADMEMNRETRRQYERMKKRILKNPSLLRT